MLTEIPCESFRKSDLVLQKMSIDVLLGFFCRCRCDHVNQVISRPIRSRARPLAVVIPHRDRRSLVCALEVHDVGRLI